jgi:hypothetical protein
VQELVDSRVCLRLLADREQERAGTKRIAHRLWTDVKREVAVEAKCYK